ncbi:MAG: DUF2335 domain-containing protein [Endomicrobium sp.]|uniref:DUF2335 domain-containing protein n=1 Tax=Candidatus Endomicrobiellum pyrsonymphae TaxID=1408203 RepID=UPI0035789F08|nr:DUF2335 domain-containing protein [Endomicrobium sp.]
MNQDKSQTSSHFVTTARAVFVGPLPDPNTLAQYAKIYPGLEKTIVEMAQKQSQHRIEIENLIGGVGDGGGGGGGEA